MQGREGGGGVLLETLNYRRQWCKAESWGGA